MLTMRGERKNENVISAVEENMFDSCMWNTVHNDSSIHSYLY